METEQPAVLEVPQEEGNRSKGHRIGLVWWGFAMGVGELHCTAAQSWFLLRDFHLLNAFVVCICPPRPSHPLWLLTCGVCSTDFAVIFILCAIKLTTYTQAFCDKLPNHVACIETTVKIC